MYINSKNTKSNQFVSNNAHIVLLILKYFLLKNKLYNPATHKFHMNETKNPDTIKSSGNIGFFVHMFSVMEPHNAVNIINSSHDMMAQAMIPINILPKISHQDVWFGFADNSLLMSVILINLHIKINYMWLY